MQYAKLPLSFDEQAKLLRSRGLIADHDLLVERLENVSYYRLSGYLYLFRNSDDTFKTGTTFDTVWKFYTFDRQLRLLVLDAVERIEIAVKTNLVYFHAHQHGPFGYTNPATLPGLNSDAHTGLLKKLRDEQQRNKEIFVKHFMKKYSDQHAYLPCWMASEIMTYGMMLTLLNGVEKAHKATNGSRFGVPDDVLLSWIRAIGGIRNMCAHHSRLWNKEIGYRPLIPRQKKHPEWHVPVEVKGNRIFGMFTVLKYMLNIIAPQSNWMERLVSLLEQYPCIPKHSMGFEVNWKECPIWSNK
ncbi:Abortive infection bacteriophage resistance protein [Chitinispirillum alkaliphilum]|nr:Abortive infection bacteriophage resistance protein [Chitinispirillum alkaliphilum]